MTGKTAIVAYKKDPNLNQVIEDLFPFYVKTYGTHSPINLTAPLDSDKLIRLFEKKCLQDKTKLLSLAMTN